MEYQKGDSPTCTNSASSVESCFEKSKLTFNYEGCPDTSWATSKSKTYLHSTFINESAKSLKQIFFPEYYINCVAKWSENSEISYLVATVEEQRGSIKSLVDKKFRCFAYSKQNDTSRAVSGDDRIPEYRLSTSEQPTCLGLSDSSSGEKSLTLFKSGNQKDWF
jgi:hypothetical protein